MKIRPLGAVPQRPRTPRPVALLFPGPGRRLTAYGPDGVIGRARETARVEALLDRLAGHTCYVTGGLATLRTTTDARSWVMETWRDRYVSIVHVPSGVRVRSLRGTLAAARGPEGAAEALWEVLDWLHGYDVRAKSLGSMGWDLWRASLGRTIRLGFDPRLGRTALFGGRQECREPGVFSHQALYDLSAAYPTAQASRPFGLYLRTVSPSTDLDPGVSGLARARVLVPSIDPERPYGPVPWRLRNGAVTYPVSGELAGVWAWCELAAARELGYRVDVVESWAPTREVDLFGSWWRDIASKSREDLSPAAASLAKAIVNSVWGRFAMNGRRGTIRWSDEGGETPIYRNDAPHRRPEDWSAHIAAETTARVRTRILTEALYPGGRPLPVQHLDTDGFIARRDLDVGDGERGPGHWRVKAAMRRVEIRAPQIYRYECARPCCLASHNPGHYVCAGIPADAAPSYFRRAPRTRVSHADATTYDVTVPPTDPHDVEGIRRWLDEAKGLGRIPATPEVEVWVQ